MKYYKFFRNIAEYDAEGFFTNFLADTEKKGHRVMYSKLYFNKTGIDAVYLCTDEMTRSKE